MVTFVGAQTRAPCALLHDSALERPLHVAGTAAACSLSMLITPPPLDQPSPENMPVPQESPSDETMEDPGPPNPPQRDPAPEHPPFEDPPPPVEPDDPNPPAVEDPPPANR